jgi:phosphoribosylamine--glycine ligase
MKILVIGSGGREHALAQTFHSQGHKVWVFPGNGGTQSVAQPIPVGDWSMDSLVSLVDLAKKIGAELTVVGPEQPLNDGIVDLFQSKGLKIFGPTQKASILEADKGWSKTFMQKYGIPTAPFVLCHSELEAQDAVHMNFEEWGGCVVKPCGLTAGKGVTVCKTISEALKAIKHIYTDRRYGTAGDNVVIEKLLKGRELSLLAFCDGAHVVPMVPSQDHKKLFEGDEGPNTGGVGAYAPAPFATKEMLAKIEQITIARTSAGLIQEGIDYRGVLYFGLMVTDEGIYLLEYNCRFGDPEAQAILPLLKTDLASIMLDCINGHLKSSTINWSNEHSCCVVMVSEGYPFTFPTGDVITGFEKVPSNVNVFHAGTKMNGSHQVVTSGGRVLGVTGVGNTLKEAVSAAYSGVKSIDFVSAYYRRDIAYQALER